MVETRTKTLGLICGAALSLLIGGGVQALADGRLPARPDPNLAFKSPVAVVAELPAVLGETPEEKPVASKKAAGKAGHAQENASEKKLQQGGRVSIRNSSGPVSIEGWDRDVVSATTGSEEGAKQIVRIDEDPARPGDLRIGPESVPRRGGELHLRVRVPRYAQIASVQTDRGNVQIAGLEGAVNINTAGGDLTISTAGPVTAITAGGDARIKMITGYATVQSGGGTVTITQVAGKAMINSGGGDITVTRASALEFRSGSGDVKAVEIGGPVTAQAGSGTVTLKNITGDVNARLSSGDLNIQNVSGQVSVNQSSGEIEIVNVTRDVRVSSISGAITIKCAGNVEASSSNGIVNLAGIKGDVDARTASGSITLIGVIRADGHYRLRSNSGGVTIALPDDTAGFVATMSSYTGDIQTDFPLKLEFSLQRGPVNRQITGRYGDGQAQIILDSFSGTAQITRLEHGSTKLECK